MKEEVHIGNWYVGWHDWKLEFVYEICGYETGNAELHISLLGWHSLFRLPWKSKRYPNGDCDAPRYGFAIHSKAFWLYTGGNGNLDGGSTFISWYLPFTYSIPYCRHQVECSVQLVGALTAPAMIDYSDLECKDNKNWKPIHEVGPVLIGQSWYELKTYHYDYVDSYDGEIIPCTYWVEEREWRPKWLGWLGLFKHVQRNIEVQFSKEVGSEKGSWKGGVTACGYELKPNELPYECIRRMERERKL